MSVQARRNRLKAALPECRIVQYLARSGRIAHKVRCRACETQRGVSPKVNGVPDALNWWHDHQRQFHGPLPDTTDTAPEETP